MLNAQVLALALIPLLSGVVPRDGAMVSPMQLLGIEEHVTADFMVGTWKCSDEFFKWGVTDKEKSTVKSLRGQALMSLTREGEIKMTSFFIPAEGRWEVTSEGILILDPRFPDRQPQLLPVRKRDNDKIWILLPFTGGSAGIGMVRVPDANASLTTSENDKGFEKRFKGSESASDQSEQLRSKGKRGPDSEISVQENDFLRIPATRQPESY